VCVRVVQAVGDGVGNAMEAQSVWVFYYL